ncbi:hypothetical protein L615_009000000010 [Nocardioides sp. J9]|uniref:hypothetical protein n=1 Tax=unclassified Nocardioides TaxID=2615069 RepID=UPI00048C5272|nr:MULTISPECIES: hypothetical protein [unclassified Nocardioides]TWG90439.1 hypothetical protein L615_009000000010 [Nocardioides sp. J9]
MPTTRWNELDPSTRKAIMVAGAVDGVLRTLALRDLKRRTPAQVRGSRKAWGVALSLVSSGGILPVVYFVKGRRSA